MAPTRLQVVIPFHQSIAADSAALEHAVTTCYEPILRAIEEAPGVRVAVHFSGHLLDYLSRKGEDFLLRVKSLERDGRLEVLGGLFYGSIPALLSESDVRAQVQMTAEYWESFIGHAPSGFWLPELAWTAELPRMLDETGLSYGFVSAGQIAIEPGAAHGLVTLERGGSHVSAFVLSDVLSKALASGSPSAWIDGALDHTQPSASAVHTVWLRAETLGLEGETYSGFLPEWLAAIGGGRSELQTVLPSEAFAGVRPARPAKLLHRCADVTHGEHRNEAVDWPDFALQHAEVDALNRRVMRGSDKLRDAIATMEEESMEEEWSSDLATAQRLIFSAQAPDPYWNGRVPGFKDPRVRDAAVERLTRAERLIDALVQGEDDWIGAEEEDRDGDLVDEVIVSSRHLTAWIVPADGGRVRTLDDRQSGRNVFDAAVGTSARLTAQGMRDLVLDLGTTSSEVASGNARELVTETKWEQKASGIDEEGDLTYALELSAAHSLTGHGATTLNVDKMVSIAIDKPEISVTTRARAMGGRGVTLATQIPVRLGVQGVTITVNGNEARIGEHDNVEEIVLQAEDGSAVAVALSEPREVWITPATREGAIGGFFVTPVVKVEGDVETTVTITLTPVTPAEVEEEVSDADADAVDEELYEEESYEDETVESDEA